MTDNSIPEIEGFRRVIARFEEIYPNKGKIIDLARHLKSMGHAEVVVESIEITIMRTYRPLSKFHFFELLDAFFCEMNDKTFNDIFSENIADVFASIYRTANGHQRRHMLSRLDGGADAWSWSFTDAVINRIHEAVHRVDPQYNPPWMQAQSRLSSAAAHDGAPTSAKSQKQAKKLDAFAQFGHTLRVSNLTQEVNRETIRAHFGEYGQCVVKIPYSFNSVEGVAVSHGYALVRYQSREEAERARQGLEGAELDGRRISVRHYGGGPAAQASAHEQDDGRAQQQQQFRVFVHNLAPSIDTNQLRELFAEFDCCGKNTCVAWDKPGNQSRCYGWVVFDDMDSAKQAIKAMNGAVVAGRTISVSIDRRHVPSANPTEHTSGSQRPASIRPQVSQSASPSGRHAQQPGSEAHPSPFLHSLLQAASASPHDAQSTAQSEPHDNSRRFRPRNRLPPSTSDRAEPDTSQSSAAAGVVAATPQMSTTASDSPTTPEQQPVSKQASTSKRSGYVSLRLRRVRHSSSVPVDAPTPSPDPQAAREEYQAVSSVLPPPTAVRVRRPAPVQVSGAQVTERYFLISDGDRSSLLIRFLSAQADFVQGRSLTRKTVVLVSDASERDSTVLELFARLSNALASSELDAVRSYGEGLAVLVASASDFSAQVSGEFATVMFLFVPPEDVMASFNACSSVGSLSILVFGNTADADDVRRIRAIAGGR